MYFGLGGYWGWPYYGYAPYGYGYGYDPYYSDPYAYNSGYYDPGPYAQQAPAYQTAQQAPSYQQPAPQAPAYQPAPQVRQSAPQATVQNGSPDYYLIAFADHSIRAAINYHVDGNTIYWTTREHEEMSAPLSTVDRGFSTQINRDRHVDFRLP